jgi:hypothetical protein
VRGILVLALSLSMVFTPAQADTPAPRYVTRLFDTVLSYAPPPWISSPADIGNVEVFRDEGSTQNGTRAFIMEFIPKGESFESWSRLYAITAETPLREPLQTYRNGQIARYADACDGMQWQRLDAVPDDAELFVVFCPRYRADPTHGEAAVFNMQMLGRTLVKTYHHIRTAAFSPEEVNAWATHPPGFLADLAPAIAAVGSARLQAAD